jgi:eukaryotic-like serine/threonine-protein kinase
MATTPDELLQPGTVLGETYSIREKIASGGMGEVYLAEHARLRGKFAVKILNRRLALDPRAIARFKREAEILALIRHPNVVQIFDFDVLEPGIPFLVMEMVEGQDLAHHILQKGPLPLGRVVNIVHQIAAALEAAHVRRVVHGDLKPANVMLVDCEGHPDLVKVLDFGVAQLFGAHSGTREPTNLMLGTPSYMAPEQAECRNDEIDGRADQFAVAVLTYVLLTGKDPFPGDSTVEVLSRVIHAEPAPLGARVGWPAAGVEAVLRRALEKRPQARYGRILEFAYEFSRAAMPVVDLVSAPAPARPAPRTRRPSLVHLVRGPETTEAENTNAGNTSRPDSSGPSRRPTGQTTVVARPPAGLPRVA